MTVLLACDPGPRNFGWALISTTGQGLESGCIDGHELDPFTEFCDLLHRVQRKYGKNSVTVAIEDVVPHSNEGRKRGLLALKELVGKLEAWSLAKGVSVFKMRRITVLRSLGIASGMLPKGLTESQKRAHKKAIKARCKSLAEQLTKRSYETHHEADAAALGWVVARQLLATRAREKRTA
jgi:Holliday junction resolvasome RuvABC endonuclease subunit